MSDTVLVDVEHPLRPVANMTGNRWLHRTGRDEVVRAIMFVRVFHEYCHQHPGSQRHSSTRFVGGGVTVG